MDSTPNRSVSGQKWERPASTARAVHGFFPKADLPGESLLREKPCGPTLGGSLSIRISADGVGR